MVTHTLAPSTYQHSLNPSPPTSLGDLARELREEIYTWYFDDLKEHRDIILGSFDVQLKRNSLISRQDYAYSLSTPPQVFPSLCLVNRSIGSEAAAFLVRKCSWTIHDEIAANALVKVLKIFCGEQVMNAFMQLSFMEAYWVGCRTSDYVGGCMSKRSSLHMQLLSPKCSLRALSLDFHAASVADYRQRPKYLPVDEQPSLSLEAFLDIYRLEVVLECPRLRRLTLRGIERHSCHAKGTVLSSIFWKILVDFGYMVKYRMEDRGVDGEVRVARWMDGTEIPAELEIL